MWFLEHETLFGGKRVWLRPGSQQLFGRTKSGVNDGGEGKQWKIDNKAVSRKHVMLRVHEAAPEDGTKLHVRSIVEVMDLSCRQGTTIDDKTTLRSKKGADGSVEYDKATLTGEEHTIKLAQGYAPFKIVWRPIVFTYASKESKKDSKARSARLHALDMKTTTDFMFGKTTHVVSQKRNLPKVLTGLVAGKHIVTGDFLDDVLKVAECSGDATENYEPSKLEEDFDEWWPKEKECIPPVGAEPVPRPPEMLEPDSTRQEVFSGLTFAFLDGNQYNSLLEPITSGGGKALHYEVRPGETTVQEFVDYVHGVAGKKNRGATSNDKLSVITVRMAGYPEGMEEWAARFVTGVDQVLNQRSILQNEFLDVIITKDRASLQRPPAESVNNSASALNAAPTRRSAREPTPMAQSRVPSPVKSASSDKAEPVEAPSRKRIHRPRTGGRFTGFDDYEPPPKRTKVEEVPMEDVQPPDTIIAASQPHDQSATQTQTQARHVRRLPGQHTVEREEQLDSLFPAAAMVKRQRAATRAPSASASPAASSAVRKPQSKGRAKTEPKDINVREQTRLRVKEEEDRRRANEESLREELEGIDIAKIRDITEIIDLEVRPRSDRATTRQSQADDERWNPEWNGRKNFKKFRRRGAERGLQAQKVLVPYEEAAPKKGFGVGDAFFLEDVEPSATFRSRNSRREQADDSSDAEPGFRAKKRSQGVEVENTRPESGEEDSIPTRTQRSSGRTQRVAETQIDDTQTRDKKRGAPDTAGPASKKGRIDRRDDDSDNEETGFRFKRRG